MGSAPVLEADAFDGDHYGAVLPAALFADNDTLHAYFVAFGDARGDQRVYHATSDDGTEWALDTADPFATLGLEMSPPGPIPGSVIETQSGWVMYLWGVPLPETRAAAIYRATADSPGGPWTADEEPVLPPGEPGSWDDLGLDFPAVVRASDGQFVMLYSANGGSSQSTARIGFARSADGIAWERSGEPIIEPGTCDYDRQYTAGPRLIADAEGFVVFYNTERRVGAARSDGDLADWTCAGGGILLDGPDVPGGQGIHTFAVTEFGGRLVALIESLVDGGSELWLGEVR